MNVTKKTVLIAGITLTILAGTATILYKIQNTNKSVFNRTAASSIDSKKEEKKNSAKEESTKSIDADKKREEQSSSNSLDVKNTSIGKVDKAFFSRDLFLGDSITEGLSFHECLNEENVMGIKGLDTIKAISVVDKITKTDVEKIFILIGSNDVDLDRTGKQFAEHYLNLIKTVREKLPKTKIYVQSILPITEEAEKKNPTISNRTINEYNLALKDMAKVENINYVDIGALLKANSVLYEEDGEHFKPEFYNIWLNHLKNDVK